MAKVGWSSGEIDKAGPHGSNCGQHEVALDTLGPIAAAGWHEEIVEGFR